MINKTVYNAYTKISPSEKNDLINFLYTNQCGEHLNKNEIQQSLDYALKEIPSFGGYIITARENEKVVAASVVNQTGMGAYSSSNILVYFAIDEKFQGNGLGSKLLEKTISYSKGDIAIRVSPDNPVRSLFEECGFTTQAILEMKLAKPSPQVSL